MNEYYKKRYNLYNFFLNIDNDEYNIYLSIFLVILIILLILVSIFLIVLIKDINISIIIYIIFLVLLYISSYNLIKNLQSIRINDLFLQYKSYFQLYNCIFKENLNIMRIYLNRNNINKQIPENVDNIYFLKNEVLDNIHNIENIYGEKAEKMLNTNDIFKYYDLEKYIENGLDKKLYFLDYKDFPFMRKSMPFIVTENQLKYINLEILNKSDYKEKQLLLNYINKKYNKLFTTLYIEPIFTPKFNKMLDDLINTFKRHIYYFIIISCYFIIIILQGLIYRYNMVITHIYMIIIGLSLIIMYYYNN
jgi:hypothetical protein